jgi:hypothetical protein
LRFTLKPFFFVQNYFCAASFFGRPAARFTFSSRLTSLSEIKLSRPIFSALIKPSKIIRQILAGVTPSLSSVCAVVRKPFNTFKNEVIKMINENTIECAWLRQIN